MSVDFYIHNLFCDGTQGKRQSHDGPKHPLVCTYSGVNMPLGQYPQLPFGYLYYLTDRVVVSCGSLLNSVLVFAPPPNVPSTLFTPERA